MNIWMALMAVVWIGTGMGNGVAYTPNPNHNEDKHELLCGILGAAVHKWKTTNHPGVKKVLVQAIFGSTLGGLDLNNFELHPDFNKDSSRESLCGKCQGNPHHYPGKSIPHDLLCLCTVGENGHPFNSDVSITKLCGQNPSELGCQGDYSNKKCPGANGGQGWGKGGNGRHHLEKTWEKVVKHCLKRGSSASIEEELRDLAGRVERQEYTKWEGDFHHDCGGEGHTNICVKYHGCGTRYMEKMYPQWWEHLPWALSTPNLTPAELSATVSLNASSEDIVTNGKNGPNEDYSQGTNQENHVVQQKNTQSSNHISHFSQEESSSISTGPLWLLCAVFLY